tara:strand:- start:5 stop:460 length:456 start_codon:yes stop_codon:yes gene_type:complete
MSVEGYDAQIKALLANKDKLTKKMTKDGRSEYAVQMNKLKKRMKADGASFSKALKGVKKQEKAGTFDRGAEGKSKNALRKKMAAEPRTQLTKGVHAGSRADKILSKGTEGSREPRSSEENVDLSKSLSGETAAQRKKRKEKMTSAKIAKSR